MKKETHRAQFQERIFFSYIGLKSQAVFRWVDDDMFLVCRISHIAYRRTTTTIIGHYPSYVCLYS